MGIARSTLRRSLGVAFGLCCLLLVGVVTLAALNQSSASASFDGLPTQTPRRDLPTVLDGTVFDSTQVGDLIVVGGDFTQIETIDGRVLNTSGVYAYNIDTGALIEAFLPTLSRNNGQPPRVNAIAPAGSNSVIIGGQFNVADGSTHHRLAKYSLSTGRIDDSFVANFNSSVTQLAYDDGRLFVGGDFTSVNATPRQRLAEVDVNTGAVEGSFRFDITQSSRIDSTFTFGPRFIGVTPDDILVVVHRGQMVDGFLRPGIALIDLKSNNLLGYSTNFWGSDEIWAYDADVSPDGSYIVVVSNGGDFPLMGRDAGVRFDISDRHTSNQGERWIARNFDSTYAVAISNSAVYMGGHFCNVEGPGSPVPFPGVDDYTNANSCFGTTPGSRFPSTVNRDQLAAFDPNTGTALDWDPGADGLVGVQSLAVIERGLLLGHDGTFIGRDGADRRAWNIGRHGFFDIENPNGRPPAVGGVTHTCNARTATIVGTNGDDILTGTNGDDVIVGLGGNDTINGLGGNDIICGGAQNDGISGGTGSDFISGGKGRDNIAGGDGDDVLNGGNYHDTIQGGPGNDQIRGASGNDVLFGRAGNDQIYGVRGRDRIDGGAGDDALYGQGGPDEIQGGSGNDVVVGGNGDDRCVGTTFGSSDAAGDVLTACERR